jgi:hypothetical protein
MAGSRRLHLHLHPLHDGGGQPYRFPSGWSMLVALTRTQHASRINGTRL